MTKTQFNVYIPQTPKAQQAYADFQDAAAQMGDNLSLAMRKAMQMYTAYAKRMSEIRDRDWLEETVREAL